MSGEIAFANTALESFAALVTFVLLFACIAKIKMQRGIKHVTLKEAKRNTLAKNIKICLMRLKLLSKKKLISKGNA